MLFNFLDKQAGTAHVSSKASPLSGERVSIPKPTVEASASVAKESTVSSGPQNVTAAASGSKRSIQADSILAPGGFPGQVSMFSTPVQTTMLQGIVSDRNNASLLPYLRDMYYYDTIGGSVVDIYSSFPFSDYTLIGLESNELAVFEEAISRLNIRALMQEISKTYLVDGMYCGTLMYNGTAGNFQDILVHDAAGLSVSPQPFNNLMPSLISNMTGQLSGFVNSGNPYVKALLSGYSPEYIESFMRGEVALDPFSTLYVPRRGLRDTTHTSFLRRLLPIYLYEKVLYRGTLIESHRRQRSTTHIKLGNETWIPTDAELDAHLERFMASEADPLGGWVATREGVEISEVRSVSELWRWDQTIDTLVPQKLRALGVSEAFLAGDASFATAEAATSVFLDSADAYRQYQTHQVFAQRIFPLIAVLHGLYKDPSKAFPNTSARNIMLNITNTSNLKLPRVQWHKSLEGRDVDSQMDLLDTLSQKGFVIPLKMWAAAANIDVGSLIRDLREDVTIKAQMEAITGKRAESIGNETDGEFSGDNFDSGDQVSRNLLARLNRTKMPARSYRTSSQVGLLGRSFESSTINMGKKTEAHIPRHDVLFEHRAAKKQNDIIVRALRALQDPEHRKKVTEAAIAKFGSPLNPCGGK